jgi:hypothetical protein
LLVTLVGFAGHFPWDLPVILDGITRSLSVGLSKNLSLMQKGQYSSQSCTGFLSPALTAHVRNGAVIM